MELTAIFPELDAISDEALRTGVISAWRTAADANGIEIDDLEAVPWFPPAQRTLGLAPDAVSLVDHVRDVTDCAVGLAESLSGRSYAPDIDVDTVLAGALVHDVSKLYEFDGMDRTDIGRLLGHPYFGVSVAARAALPAEISHIILSHSPRTAVEPATIEAELIRDADAAAAAAIRADMVTDLRDV